MRYVSFAQSGTMAVAFVVLFAAQALAANVAGLVVDLQGHAVKGVRIVVKTTTDADAGQATTDSRGIYEVTGLTPGNYKYVLNPIMSGFQGGSAMAYLGDSGLTIDWRVSQRQPALAVATQNASTQVAGDPFGLSAGAFAAVVGGAAAAIGGIVGGYAAAGGFSSGTPSSPSL